MATTVSKPFYSSLVRHGEDHHEVTLVTNDLTASCEADGFRDAFPDRYVSAGMAEQALVASLSGMVAEGLYPIYTSFAVFCTRRPYEQVALTLAYPARKATMVGFLPGLMTPGGVTHQAVDDIGLMTGLPNMTVVEAADATDMASILDAVYPVPGPTYIRGLRGEVPQLFGTPLELGRHRTIFDGEDVLVIVSGHLTAATQLIVSELRGAHPGLGLVNVATLKPFDDHDLHQKISRATTVVTVENHWVSSGLGKIVGEVILEHGYKTALRRVGVKDTFTHGGSPAYLEDFYGIGPTAIRNTILHALGQEDTDGSGVVAGGKVGLTDGVAEGL